MVNNVLPAASTSWRKHGGRALWRQRTIIVCARRALANNLAHRAQHLHIVKCIVGSGILRKAAYSGSQRGQAKRV